MDWNCKNIYVQIELHVNLSERREKEEQGSIVKASLKRIQHLKIRVCLQTCSLVALKHRRSQPIHQLAIQA